MSFLVRPARAEDAAEMARLLTQLGYPVGEAEAAARWRAIAASPRHAVFVAAAAEGPLAGLVAVERRLMLELGERCEIVALVVDAHLRRGGVGRALADAARAWAQAGPGRAMMVRSSVAREASHRFYERVGFRNIKTQHVYELRLE